MLPGKSQHTIKPSQWVSDNVLSSALLSSVRIRTYVRMYIYTVAVG